MVANFATPCRPYLCLKLNNGEVWGCLSFQLKPNESLVDSPHAVHTGLL